MYNYIVLEINKYELQIKVYKQINKHNGKHWMEKHN